MSLKSDIQYLRGIWFFNGFTDDHLRLIAFSAEGRSLPQRTDVYVAGSTLQSGYLLTSGRLIAHRPGFGPETGVFIEPGTLLAERALVVDMEAAETVVTAVDSSILQIRRSVFRRFLDEYPEAAVLLRARLMERLKQSSDAYNAAAEKIGRFGT